MSKPESITKEMIEEIYRDLEYYDRHGHLPSDKERESLA